MKLALTSLILLLLPLRAAAQCSSSFPSDATIAPAIAAATSKTITIAGGNVSLPVPCRQDADAGTFTFGLNNLSDGTQTRATLMLTDPYWNGASLCYWVRVFKHTAYSQCNGSDCESSMINYDPIIRTATWEACSVDNLQCDAFSGILSPGQTDKIDIDVSATAGVYIVNVYYDFNAGNVYGQPMLSVLTYQGSSATPFSHEVIERDQCR